MTVESDQDLQGLRKVGRVVALTREEMKRAIEPGMTTRELDQVGASVFERYGARSVLPTWSMAFQALTASASTTKPSTASRAHSARSNPAIWSRSTSPPNWTATWPILR
jgi:hypothetical protein